MSTVAFVLIGVMLGMYVLLDGYDLGVAAITPLVARTDREREGSMRAIGPFWNGNEVWLIAAGAALFALFPKAYASSFSGFYLPLIIVLWLLMGRGIAMELRAHFPSEIWHTFWDACFALSSALLIVLFGVALGNLLHGLPLDDRGFFTGTFARLLNPYALVVGLFALCALALHGCAFLVMRTRGAATERARTLASKLGYLTLALYALVSLLTVIARGVHADALLAIPALTLAAFVWMLVALRRGAERATFAASSLWLATLMLQAAATLYPDLLTSLNPSIPGISIFDAAPSPAALASALAVTIVGLVAVLIYGTYVTRRLAGKLSVGE